MSFLPVVLIVLLDCAQGKTLEPHSHAEYEMMKSSVMTKLSHPLFQAGKLEFWRKLTEDLTKIPFQHYCRRSDLFQAFLQHQSNGNGPEMLAYTCMWSRVRVRVHTQFQHPTEVAITPKRTLGFRSGFHERVQLTNSTPIEVSKICEPTRVTGCENLQMGRRTTWQLASYAYRKDFLREALNFESWWGYWSKIFVRTRLLWRVGVDLPCGRGFYSLHLVHISRIDDGVHVWGSGGERQCGKVRIRNLYLSDLSWNDRPVKIQTYVNIRFSNVIPWTKVIGWWSLKSCLYECVRSCIFRHRYVEVVDIL